MVTRDTRWPAGTPCWVDVSVDDVPKAIAFYQALFGWDIQAGGPEVGGYAIAHHHDRIVAGLGPKFGAPDAPSAWTTYLAADDADAIAEKIKAAGGQVVQGPLDVMEEGRMAIAFDTTGAPFGLWQGGRTTGVGLANQTGALTWNEHVSWDFDAGKAFYRAVFGYDYQDVSGDGFRYAMLMVDGREVGGIGQYLPGTPAGIPAAWGVYFAVDDTDAAVAATVEHGGSVVRPIRDSPYGRTGVVTDNQGAVFSLISSPQPQVSEPAGELSVSFLLISSVFRRRVLGMDSEPGYLRIATEEAFAPPELVTLWRAMLADGTCDDPGFVSLQGFYMRSKAERPAAVLVRLQDLGERRIADMDAAGVDRQIVSLTCPGTQILDRDQAIAMATLANDRLAEACRRYPDRFSGLTAIAPQDPKGAAEEIERGARRLGLVGVIINSHTQGEYLDDPKFWPIFEAAEALDTPIYLHPNTPPRNMIGPMLEAGLDSAIYGFAVETGLHLLRIITAGVFDRFPRLRIVVGHLGEALPFWLYRLDFMHAATVKAGRYESMKPIQRRPSDYLRSNVWVTTSGMPWAPAIMFCREVLGPDRVMYAMDYPYEYVPEEVTAQDELPLDAAAKKAFFQGIAEQVFGLLR